MTEDRAQIERERAIAEKAWRRGATGSPTGSMALSQEERLRAYLDREYPLPEPEPRIVKGKSGAEFRVVQGDGIYPIVQVRTDGRGWSDIVGIQSRDILAFTLALLRPEGAADLFERMRGLVFSLSSDLVPAERARAVAAYDQLVKEAAK